MTAYLAGRFLPAQRRLVFLAAIVLLPVFFLPLLHIWEMRLWAPQYPEGLELRIYTNAVRGDVDKINELNHYVGMRAIRDSDFREFRYLPLALTLFGAFALLAGVLNRRWLAALGWLAFTGFAAYMFRDYALWLWRYGHELDPRAAIQLPSFTPPVIGYKHMANFRVISVPGPGTLLLGAAWLLGPLAVWLESRAGAPAAKPKAA